MSKDGFEKGGGINKVPSNDNVKTDADEIIAGVNQMSLDEGGEPLDEEEEAMIREVYSMSEAEMIEREMKEKGETEEEVRQGLEVLRRRLLARVSDFRVKNKQSIKEQVIKGGKKDPDDSEK